MKVLVTMKLVVCIWVFVYSFSFKSVSGISQGTVFIDGSKSIGKIDDDFICATLDWWPPDKCDYGTCSWYNASVLNLDLDNVIFLNAVKAFSPLKIRIGGTLEDKVIYQTKDSQQPCNSFVKKPSELFGFTQGCLPLARWDKLNDFFNKSGAILIFGLNALNGKSIQKGSAIGNWDSTNAESFIAYTVENGYKIHGWELGNELSGNGVGVRVASDQYAYDTINLYNKVEKIYKDVGYKPIILAPGGFFEATWFKGFIIRANKSLDVITHHIYNLGPGVDEHLIDKILNPTYLDGEATTFSNLQNTLKSSGTAAKAWVGESGGAYNSGRNGVTNAFVFSFWYLDQLGMASAYDTKTYCRQSLIGGNYGLLNTTTFVPNPDFYSALLFHRLMGQNVISTNFTGTNKIRAYAHCAKQSEGVTLLLINLDGNNTVQVNVEHNGALKRVDKHAKHRYGGSKHGFRMLQGKETGSTMREEYHLTAKDGDIHSQVMVLNGNELTLDAYGNIPPLEPVTVNSTDLIIVAPFSIVFVHVPSVILDACS